MNKIKSSLKKNSGTESDSKTESMSETISIPETDSISETDSMSETEFLNQLEQLFHKTNKKQWFILIFTGILCILAIYLIITYKFSLPQYEEVTNEVRLLPLPNIQNSIINYNECDCPSKKNKCNDLSKRIENIEERYSTLVSEIGIWITFLVGIMTIITLIIGYILQDKAKEQYKGISFQLYKTNKQLINFKEKFKNEFLLKENFYHSCLGLQAIYMNTKFTTPLIKSMVSKMLYNISELRNIATKTSNEWITRSDEFLMLHKTLNYIFPILRSKNEIVNNVYQIQSLQDKLTRLLFLQGKLISNLPLDKQEVKSGENSPEKELITEIKSLIDLIFSQANSLARILQDEARKDIYSKTNNKYE